MNRTRGEVLVVDADLMALSRINEAAGRAGREVKTASGESFPSAVLPGSTDIVVLDLDRGGTDLVRLIAEALAEAAERPRILAFFSHINEELGRASKEAGFETFARGVFWRSLDELLA